MLRVEELDPEERGCYIFTPTSAEYLWDPRSFTGPTLRRVLCLVKCSTVIVLIEKKLATHSSILAWRIPWTEEAGGLWSMGSDKTERLTHIIVLKFISGGKGPWFHFAVGPTSHRASSASLLFCWLWIYTYNTWITFFNTRILQPTVLCPPLKVSQLSVNLPTKCCCRARTILLICGGTCKHVS